MIIVVTFEDEVSWKQNTHLYNRLMAMIIAVINSLEHLHKHPATF